MAPSDEYAFRKGSFSSQSLTSSTLRRNWIPISAALWFIISFYPVLVFFTGNSPSSGQIDRVSAARATVTKTIVMPEIPATALPGAVNQQEPENAYRVTDAVDDFKNFKTSDSCRFSSLDLHGPFEPLCEDRETLLKAMSWGGRLGVDAPFSPRGCDMRWFSGAEICQIMSRFSRINIMGDSMMRNLAVAVQIFLRQDLVDGGRSDWVADPEGHDCRCEAVFDDRTCTFNAVVSTSMTYENVPHSMLCPEAESAAIEYFHLLDHPIRDEDIETFQSFQDADKPAKPVAFVMGHGLWNDLDKYKTFAWIDQVMNATVDHAPYLIAPNALFPRLFLTPNAAGEKKPDIFIARQGNVALARFEKTVGAWVRERGIDHLGTWNATIQSFNPDGTHGGMRNNMIKAMMVFNWLNAIDVKRH